MNSERGREKGGESQDHGTNKQTEMLEHTRRHADITKSFYYLGRQFSLSLAGDSSSVPLLTHCQMRIKGAQKWTSRSAFPASCPLFLETKPRLVTRPAHMALPVIG